ncbi:hypothetical protein ACFFHM_19345 [Halalkalibacter kiskunsagensis]|uniref:Uncharacterized protein n=1 Tax=Halalkalibacter kiskunsagensis TaxID=1548599 RepID=A0ABV6KGZ0_9BACI
MKIISWYAHKENKKDKKEENKTLEKIPLKDIFKAKKNNQD